MRAVLAALALLLAAVAARAAAGDPTGYWKTIDDETGRPRSVVLIERAPDGSLQGRIVKLFREPGEDADPVCDKCEGELHNRRIIGMRILQGLRPDGDEWSGGTILDPANGQTYRCLLAVRDGGRKLDVRGYIGISLIGRTQTWLRTDRPTDEVEYLDP